MSRATKLRWMAFGPMIVGFASVIAAYTYPIFALGAMIFGFQTALFLWAAEDVRRRDDTKGKA